MAARIAPGDRAAIQALWQRYHEPLLRVAEARLRGAPCRAGDGEDVTVDAFLRFCADIQKEGRFPNLSNRDHLLRLMARFTAFEALDFRARAVRRHRAVRGDSALGEAGFELHAGQEPPPEFQAQVASLLDKLSKLTELDDQLPRVAQMRLEGCTNQEIAAVLDCSVATVERRVSLIRRHWQADWEALHGANEDSATGGA
jgi:DNA-directed RNA polymerase specialized sigma24 family protein